MPSVWLPQVRDAELPQIAALDDIRHPFENRRHTDQAHRDLPSEHVDAPYDADRDIASYVASRASSHCEMLGRDGESHAVDAHAVQHDHERRDGKPVGEENHHS